MQARFDVDAPSDLTGCDPDDINLIVKLVHPGDVTTEICPDSNIDWAAAISAIESGGTTWIGRRGFGSKGGFMVGGGVVAIMSPDGGGEGSVVTVTVKSELCLDTFKQIRDAVAEFAANPVEFARKHRQSE